MKVQPVLVSDLAVTGTAPGYAPDIRGSAFAYDIFSRVSCRAVFVPNT